VLGNGETEKDAGVVSMCICVRRVICSSKVNQDEFFLFLSLAAWSTIREWSMIFRLSWSFQNSSEMLILMIILALYFSSIEIIWVREKPDILSSK